MAYVSQSPACSDSAPHLELLPNGYVRVDAPSGLVSLVDPTTGRVHSGYRVADETVAEIQRRWGGAR